MRGRWLCGSPLAVLGVVGVAAAVVGVGSVSAAVAVPVGGSGRVVGVCSSVDSVDRASETVGASTTRYVRDVAGQLCWSTTGVLAPGASCGSPVAGATVYSHDAAGRLLTETVSATNSASYTYDAAGRVASAQRVNGATTTTQTRSYDPLGQLSGVVNTGGSTTSSVFDWDPTGVVSQLVGITTGNATTDLVQGPIGPVARRVGPGHVSVGVDVYGSVIPTTATGTLVRSATYSAYGVASGVNTFEPRLGYRGELTLDNQVHLRARSFQPSIGQFLSVDPVEGVPGTTTVNNRYTYANNDPVHQIDPLGLYGIDDGSLEAQRWPDVAVVFGGDGGVSPDEAYSLVKYVGVQNSRQAVTTANSDSGWDATRDATKSIGKWGRLGQISAFGAVAGIALGCAMTCLYAYESWEGAWAAEDVENYQIELTRQRVLNGQLPPGTYGGYEFIAVDNHGTPVPATEPEPSADGAGAHSGNPPGGCATNTFEPSPKHDQTRPGVGTQPTNGQSALDRSVQVSDTSSRRVGVDPRSGQIVVFDETYPGQCIFHGHVRTWDQLTQKMQSALYKAGLTDLKGRIL